MRVVGSDWRLARNTEVTATHISCSCSPGACSRPSPPCRAPAPACQGTRPAGTWVRGAPLLGWHGAVWRRGPRAARLRHPGLGFGRAMEAGSSAACRGLCPSPKGGSEQKEMGLGRYSGGPTLLCSRERGSAQRQAEGTSRAAPPCAGCVPIPTPARPSQKTPAPLCCPPNLAPGWAPRVPVSFWGLMSRRGS